MLVTFRPFRDVYPSTYSLADGSLEDHLQEGRVFPESLEHRVVVWELMVVA